jgi:hypothetical protein
MIDLHVHSTFSDGSLTPEQLLAEAAQAGLTAIALTDHDSVGGLKRFIAAAAAGKVRGIPGVEISADSPSGSMHILGYDLDPAAKMLNEQLEHIRKSRAERNEKILYNLNKLGLHLTMNEIQSQAGEDIVGRLHFARALQVRGYVQTTDEAFGKYLAKGKPAYGERLRLSPADGIRMIREAGGVAVLAHPFTLQMNKPDLDALVGELAGLGLAGLEVLYPQHNARTVKEYRRLAAKHNLAVTGGTDFHGASIPAIKLGVGFGDLRVPDELLDLLLQRKTS